MDLSISNTQGGEAAAASNRTKRTVLALCMLLAAGMYVSQERSRATLPEVRPGQARPDMHEVAARYARPGDAAALAVRKVFYDGQEGVYCGEVSGRTSTGAEARFRDGVRIFVCGPGLHD